MLGLEELFRYVDCVVYCDLKFFLLFIVFMNYEVNFKNFYYILSLWRNIYIIKQTHPIYSFVHFHFIDL
jgi:hypothetical protein